VGRGVPLYTRERSEKGQTSPAEVGDNNYHADTKDFIQVYRERY